MPRYTLDIGVDAVAAHAGYPVVRADDGSFTEIPVDALADAAGPVKVACVCGWIGTDQIVPSKIPSQMLLQRTVKRWWEIHVYNDVAPVDQQESLRLLRGVLDRLGRNSTDIAVGDIYRDLTAGVALVERFMAATAKQPAEDVLPAVPTPGSMTRSALAAIDAVAESSDWTPEQAYQVTHALTHLLDQVPDALGHARAAVITRRGDLYQDRGRDVNVDEIAYSLDRATHRAEQAQEHLHRVAHLLDGVHEKDDYEY